MRSRPITLKLSWVLRPRLESHTHDVPRGEDSLYGAYIIVIFLALVKQSKNLSDRIECARENMEILKKRR